MTGDMRVLTVRQPWAWAIIHGGKNVENRVRNLAGDYRGPVAIHVAQQEDEGAYSVPVLRDALEARYRTWSPPHGALARMRSEPAPKYLGRVIGVVDLVDVHHADDSDCAAPAPLHRAVDGHWERPCSPWAEPAAHHLVLEHPRPLVEPIPYRGALGLRHLDPETINQVTAALAAERSTR